MRTPSPEFIADQGRKLFEFRRTGRGASSAFFRAIGVRSQAVRARICEASVAYGKSLDSTTAGALTASPLSLDNILRQVMQHTGDLAVAG